MKKQDSLLWNPSMAERDRLWQQMRIGNMPHSDFKPQTFDGILDLNCPELVAMVMPDSHLPGHNRQVMDLILSVQRRIRPLFVIWIGDVLNNAAMSRWAKMPYTQVSQNRELDVARNLIQQFGETGDARMQYFILGNHENWTLRYVAENPVLASIHDHRSGNPMLSLPRLLGCEMNDNIMFLVGADGVGGKEGGLLLNRQFRFKHGEKVRQLPGESGRATMDEDMFKIAMGHVHRMANIGCYSISNDELRYGVELGCIADFTGPHPDLAYSGRDVNWHYGFGLLTISNGIVHVQPVPIYEAFDERGSLHFYCVINRTIFKSSHF